MSNLYCIPKSVEIEAIKSVVDTINSKKLTDKEKAFIGVNGQPFLNEYFCTVANGVAPDANIWTVVTDGTGTLVTDFVGGAATNCVIKAGNVGTDDSYMDSLDKITVDTRELQKSTINFKTRMAVVDNTGEFGVGLIKYGVNPTADIFTTGVGNYVAGVYCNNDLVNAISNDGNAVPETTDISAFMGEGVYRKILVVYSKTSVLFYIDDVLRATHSNRIPDYPLMVAMAAKNTNAIETVISVSSIEVWTE